MDHNDWPICKFDVVFCSDCSCEESPLAIWLAEREDNFVSELVEHCQIEKENK